ncbi:MAG: PHP domain-containing protein [Chloroflexi bacterium]|nr:PHP domain-containing protein [Chloroflexota bacterium]
MRTDLHVHSRYSMDSATTLEQIVKRCLKSGVNCIAVADHGTAAGGIELQKIAPFKVIVAEEILTHEGEIIGLFLKQTIPSKIPAVEAISRIRDQGGLICLPHPCDRLRESVLCNGRGISDILPHADIVEVFNSRTLPPDANEKARKLAAEYGKPGSAGSDAHTASEIGNAWIEMPDFDGPEGFLSALAQGSIFGRRSSPAQRAAGLWSRIIGMLSNGKAHSKVYSS